MPALPQLAPSQTIDDLALACADEQAARKFIEAGRWNGTPCCPHCGDVNVYRMTGATAERRGLWRCRGCKRQFTVRVGTIYEDSKFPLRMWCKAFWEVGAAKNGISALELSRKLQCSYKSALFLLTRIRFAMADGPESPKLNGVVEADECYVGGKPRLPMVTPTMGKRRMSKGPARTAWSTKTPVFAVVQQRGEVRARVMPVVTSDNIRTVLNECVEQRVTVCTDEAKIYRSATRLHDKHRTVNHSLGEFVSRKDRTVTTNSVESFFARIKRKIGGTHHAVSKEHLHRYISEAAFMFNSRGLNDGERTLSILHRCEGKRIMYRQSA